MTNKIRIIKTRVHKLKFERKTLSNGENELSGTIKTEGANHRNTFRKKAIRITAIIKNSQNNKVLFEEQMEIFVEIEADTEKKAEALFGRYAQEIGYNQIRNSALDLCPDIPLFKPYKQFKKTLQ